VRTRTRSAAADGAACKPAAPAPHHCQCYCVAGCARVGKPLSQLNVTPVTAAVTQIETERERIEVHRTSLYA
jgi:hypothetical protein